ncbi:MAG: HAMP domain-containing histidine kinase [Chloroflexi bacterium]|nr:HAMP domain-containing histidine kinase [Chloroflexota bacterium]MCI0882600.1 HAMP domain-containing histidine kinase [Chloroflexota bacterium]
MLKRIAQLFGVEALAIASGLGLTLLLLSPGSSDAIELGAYLGLSALISFAAVEVLIRSGVLASRMRLKYKITLAAGIGAGLAFLNAFAMSALMFVNTVHDLPMLLAILVFAAVIAGYAAVRMSSSISGSMSTLAHHARRLSGGDLSVRMPVAQGDPDVDEVATAFNEMAANLEETAAKKEQVEQSRRELSAAISHDLRTPISSARVMLEAIRDGVTSSAEERDEYLDRVLTQMKSLGSMVDDLFDLSLLDAGELRLDLHLTVVDELVDEALLSMQSTAQDKGLTLSAVVDEALGEAVMDSRQVRRVLLNLIQNAIRHTPPDGTVTVAANRVDDRVEFEVRDTGEGFDQADSARIWTRFFRSDPARSRVDDESAQSGLGLSIARGIVELHGGTISAHSSPSQGAAFRFWIPDGRSAVAAG